MVLLAVITAVNREWLTAVAMAVGAGVAFVGAVARREPDLTVAEGLREATRVRLFMGFTVLLVTIVAAILVSLRSG